MSEIPNKHDERPLLSQDEEDPYEDRPGTTGKFRDPGLPIKYQSQWS